MKTQSLRALIAITSLVFVFNACGKFSAATSAASNASSSATLMSASNVLPVSLECGYANEPCVTVTICQPGTGVCQSIPNVLLDTGSYGLRLFTKVSTDGFASATTSLLTLPAVSAGAERTLAECVSYGDGSSDWGSVASADVYLGGELASNVSIQIIDANFATAPSDCANLDAGPLTTGFNGILGVGLFTDDCGSGCATDAANGIYYACPAGGPCVGAAVAEANQVSNPVAFLSTDHNGVALRLPSVPVAFGTGDGAASADGYLILGIGTRANNQPAAGAVFPTDGYGNIVTTFNGVTLSHSFIDSGSAGLYFPVPSNVPTCSDNPYLCATQEMSYVATMSGAGGRGTTLSVPFQIGNADQMFSRANPNVVFADLGGTATADFDWGLPFFLGRTVYVQLESGSSGLGSGSLWAF